MIAQSQQPRFQPLTCIQQTGTKRTPDGTTTYSFVAHVSRDLPAVTITLQVTPQATLTIGAIFDERARVEIPQEDDHRNEGQQLALPVTNS